MRLKFILPLTTLLFLFISLPNFGQADATCGTEATAEQIEYMSSFNKDRALFPLASLKDDLDSVPLKIHIITESDGSGGLALPDLEATMVEVNEHYEAANMFFFFCGEINYIRNSDYYDYQFEDEDPMGLEHDEENVINVYFAGSLENGTLCGYTYFPPSADRVLMANDCTGPGRATLAHELGHYFELYHTHGKTNCGAITDELVDGSNCTTAGDDVCDTPADPNLRDINCDNFLVDLNCNYTGSYTDDNGDAYQPDTENIMSYSRNACRSHFSDGQMQRIAFSYANARSYLSLAPCIGDGCQGQQTLTDCSGTISDGSGTANYEAQVSCEWIIEPFDATSITINFNSLNTEAGADTIEIFDGNSSAGTLIGVYSGNTLPSTIVTTTGAAFIRFTSNESVEGAGWNLSYTCDRPFTGPCDGDRNLSSCNGFIEDGSGSSPYQNNQDCRWFIDVPGSTFIQFDFTSIDLESGFDYVRLYDGPSVASPLIGSYSGTINPGTINSSGPQLTVVFTTDGSVTRGGFEATYACSNDPLPPSCLGQEEINDCDGFISDGSNNGSYSPDLDCEWLIDPTNTNTFLEFSFSGLELGFGDTLFFYDGPTTADPLINFFVEGSLATAFNSTSPSVLIRFKTDSEDQLDGWGVFYSCNFTQPPLCSGTTILTECSGTFDDGSGENDYQNNSDCRWLVDVPSATFINIDFLSFDLESGFDDLIIYDGPTTASPILGVYSGSVLPGSISSTSNQVLFLFDTDGSVVRDGFEIQYTCSNDPLPATCDGLSTYNGCFGSFDDGSANRNYSPDLDCEYQIFADGATSINLIFFEFATELNADSVVVYEGEDITGTRLGSYSGDLNFFNVLVPGEYAFLKFYTNGSTEFSGWELEYNCSYDPLPACNGVTELTDCEGSFSDNSGASDYGNNSNCEWRINTATGDYIELDFTAFDTEGNFDYVRVYDGPTNASPLIGTYDGFFTNPPQNIFSSGTSMTVVFTTDGSVTRDGFSAEYFCRTGTTPGSCTGGETFSACSGTITDGSNGNYSNDLDCDWLIEVPGALSLSIQFFQFDTEENFDIVRIYDGPTAAAPLIGTYSGGFIPNNINTTGNSAFITFTTDGSVTRDGWALEYNCSFTPSQYCDRFTTLTDCNGSFSDGSEQDFYLNSTDCEWLISTGANTSIQLDFVEFNTEGFYDEVTVYDGPNTAAPIIGTYSGNLAPFSVNGGSELFVTFTTDGSVTREGWSATYSCANGISENLNLAEFKVYPNPSKGLFNLELSVNTTDDLTIEVSDIQGRSLFQKQLNNVIGSVRETLDLHGFAKGVYHLSVASNNGVSTEKIIID